MFYLYRFRREVITLICIKSCQQRKMLRNVGVENYINYNLSGFFLNIVWHVFNNFAVITLEKHLKAGSKMMVL